MYTIGAKSDKEFLRCPRCGGVLLVEDDGYELYLNCMGCAREYNQNLTPRRMTIKQLTVNRNIKMIEGKECRHMRL